MSKERDNTPNTPTTTPPSPSAEGDASRPSASTEGDSCLAEVVSQHLGETKRSFINTIINFILINDPSIGIAKLILQNTESDTTPNTPQVNCQALPFFQSPPKGARLHISLRIKNTLLI